MESVCHSMTKGETDKQFCPACEKMTGISLISKKETLPVLGEPVEYEALVYKCSECGVEFAPTDLEDQNLRKAYDIYRKRHKLLIPEDIRTIREQYGLSQRNFSRFLGWGDITIHRYESGALQDVAHNETLVLIKDDPDNARKILDLNRENLSHHIAESLEARIHELMERETPGKKPFDLWGLEYFANQKATIMSGYRSFDLEKFENTVLLLLAILGGVFKTKLNKLLWYCDFTHFKRHAIGITGACYKHLPFGPTPDEYDLYLWAILRRQKVENEEIIFDHDKAGELLCKIAREDLSLFTDDEQETIKYVAETLGPLNAKQISEKSHEEAAYKNTKHLEFISYNYASKLSI